MFQRRRVRRDTVTPAPYVASPSEEWEGNDGSWSTFRIHIGTPGQNFRVLPSTAGSETWVPMPDGCTSRDPEDCPQQRGVELFNGQSSRGFLWNESTTWTETGLYTLDLEASLGYEGHGHYGSDNVTLGSTQDPGTLGLGRQIVAGIADTDYFLGIFGLGIRPVSFSSSASTLSSFLVNAYNQSLIPSLSYGYTAGAPYRLKRVLGNLVLGGYDSSRFNPSLLSFSFAEEDSRALTVGIQSIIASNTLLGVASFTPKGHLSVIDSTVPDIWLPRDACDLMAEAFGLTYDELTELYVINDTMRSKMQQLKPSITFKLGNTAYDNGNSTNIVLPYAAFDLQARWPYYKNPTNYFPIRRAANDSQYTLGRTFLQEAYLIVDHERTNFTVNQATFLDPTSAAQIVTINPINSKSPSSTNLSGGAIGGIVAGAVVLLLAGAIAIWFFRFRKPRRRIPPELDGNDKPIAFDLSASDNKKPPLDHPTELNDTSIQELGDYVPSQDHKGHYAPASQELESRPAVFELSGDPRFFTQPHGPPSEIEGSPGPSLLSPRSIRSDNTSNISVSAAAISPAYASTTPASPHPRDPHYGAPGLIPPPLSPQRPESVASHRGSFREHLDEADRGFISEETGSYGKPSPSLGNRTPVSSGVGTGTGYYPSPQLPMPPMPGQPVQQEEGAGRQSWEGAVTEEEMFGRGHGGRAY